MRLFLCALLFGGMLVSCGMDPSLDSPITINYDRCVGSSCRVCERVCPYDAMHFYGPEDKPMVDPDKCTQCGICVRECPWQAITGRPQ